MHSYTAADGTLDVEAIREQFPILHRTDRKSVV